MKATYNKETREWTIVCPDNMTFGLLTNALLFASDCESAGTWQEHFKAAYDLLRKAWKESQVGSK